MLAISGELNLERPAGSIVAQAGTAMVREGNLIAMTTKSSTEDNAASRIRNRVAGGMMGMDYNLDGPLRPAFESLEQPVTYRSVYLPVVRDNIPRALDVFDFAESTMVVGQRDTSNTPDQGLFFMNSTFVIDRAIAMAKLLNNRYSNSEEQIAQAFLMAYGRAATEQEHAAAKQFYRDYQPTEPGPGRARRPIAAQFNRLSGGSSESSLNREPADIQKMAALCQSILASAEFRFVN
jgi:Protein of unknown function (DUF1553)